MHPNPAVASDVQLLLSGHARILITPPLLYLEFLWLLRRAAVVLTDSGGVQEEAPVLGKPVIVLRDTTERREGIEAGIATLAGTDPARIARETVAALRPSGGRQPHFDVAGLYGDGKASERIIDFVVRNVQGIEASQVAPGSLVNLAG